MSLQDQVVSQSWVRTATYRWTLQIRDVPAGNPVDVSGWTFAAAYKRPNQASADFSLATVTSGQGFRKLTSTGDVEILITTTTLAAVPGTTGDTLIIADILATLPSGDVRRVFQHQLTLEAGV